MTTAAGILAEIRKGGGIVEIEGDRLRCRAPKGVLTHELVKTMSALKPDLMVLLGEKKVAQPAQPHPELAEDEMSQVPYYYNNTPITKTERFASIPAAEDRSVTLTFPPKQDPPEPPRTPAVTWPKPEPGEETMAGLPVRRCPDCLRQMFWIRPENPPKCLACELDHLEKGGLQ